MGNMLFSQRVGDAVGGGSKDESGEYRVFPKHMYEGPRGLGDPNHRGLSKMENDPMITQRMRDIARTAMCKELSDKFVQCSRDAGIRLTLDCRQPRDEMCKCIEDWLNSQTFREDVSEEYLNERSHFRQTGIQTKRYARGGKFLHRNWERDGPPLDQNGRYRPQKPTGWEESYSDGLPEWAKEKSK